MDKLLCPDPFKSNISVLARKSVGSALTRFNLCMYHENCMYSCDYLVIEIQKDDHYYIVHDKKKNIITLLHTCGYNQFLHFSLCKYPKNIS